MPIKPVANETELLTEVANGNEKAFKQLFNAYHNQLGEFVFSITGSAENTEEIIHDVFLKIWISREKLPDIRNFTSYMFILTRNYTLNCMRKMLSQLKQEEEYAREFEGSENAIDLDVLQEPDYQLMVEQAVLQLPPQQQKVFMLRQKGLKNMEIANLMGIAPDSVKKYQQWAIKSISQFVKSNAALTAFIATLNSIIRL